MDWLIAYGAVALILFPILLWVTFRPGDLTLPSGLIMFLIVIVCTILWPIYLIIEVINWIYNKFSTRS